MKFGLIIILVLSVETLTFAQDDQMGSVALDADDMREQLSLSEQQYVRVKSILQEYSNSREAIEIRTAAWEDSENAIDSLDSERQEAIFSVLTAEQRKKWRAYTNKRQQQNEYEVYAAQQVEEMKDELGLTDAQATQLEQIVKDYKIHVEKMKGIQRGSGQLRPEAFRKARAEYLDAVQAVLSSGQYQKWIEMSHE